MLFIFKGRLTCLSDQMKNAQFILLCLSVAVSRGIVYYIFMLMFKTLDWPLHWSGEENRMLLSNAEFFD